MSETFLATASVRIVPDVTGFAAALQTQVAAATRAVRIPAVAGAIQANTVATKTFAAATGVSTLAVKQNAVALEVEGAAAATSAAETRLSAKAAREAAVAHSQMARGVATATASQFGLRGAVLASSGPFLAAVVAVEILRKTIDEFSAEQEAAARVTKVFGAAGKDLEENAHGLAAGFGLSAAAALKFEGAIGEVFHNVGLASGRSAEFSERLVKLSADVGAFNNADPSQVLRAFQLGLSGNLRGLRQFIPGVTAARVALQAMADTGKKTKSSLTDQELTVARYEVILQAASNQVGTYAERSGDLAVQTKTLQSNIQNLAGAFGKLATPVLLDVATNANLVFTAFEKLKGLGTGVPGGGLVETILGKAHDLGLFATLTGPVGAQIGLVKFAIDELTGSAQRSAAPLGLIPTLLRFIGDEARNTAINLNALRFDIATNAISALTEHLTQLEIVGASSAQKIATLQQKADEARNAVRSATTVQGRRSARDTRAAALAEINSIRASDAAAAKSAASAAESAAKQAAAAAEAARRQHDQDIQTANDRLQFTADLAHLKAQRTKSLVDDLAADKVELRIINEKIVNASKILDATTREQTLEQLTLDKERARQQIAADRAAQVQRQKDQRDLIRDRAAQRLELDIEIASTNKAKSAEIKAREARIAFDREQLKTVHGDIVRRKQLQLEIAQDTQAIKDLKKAKQDNMGATLGFIALQTQQGFVSNLLSNLLSTSATAGTVGGTAGAISTPTSRVGNPLPPPGTGFPSASSSLSAASQVAGGPAGASSGQLATLIHVQRQMLAVMLRLAGQRTHPEATHQRTWAATEMLNTGW